MVQIYWRCNLDDVLRYEKFPKELPYRPMVGDIVESSVRYGKYKEARLELKVVRCVITESGMEVELHLKGNCMGQDSVMNFNEYYRKLRSF
jgi:hypothetical protein